MTPSAFAAAIQAAREGQPPAHSDPAMHPFYGPENLRVSLVVAQTVSNVPKGSRIIPPGQIIPLLF